MWFVIDRLYKKLRFFLYEAKLILLEILLYLFELITLLFCKGPFSIQSNNLNFCSFSITKPLLFF